MANTDPVVRSSERAHKIAFYIPARPNLGIKNGHCRTSTACRDVGVDHLQTCLISQEPTIPLEGGFL